MQNRKPRDARRSPAMMEGLEPRQLMSTYYVSLSGNDGNAGTSASAPWKSIGKINAVNFKPGDNILFQGGQTFSGSLYFSGGDGGSAASSVTVGSYNGRATISSGTSDGAKIWNTSGILFDNLKFQGAPGVSSQYGIDFETNSGALRPNIGVNNCEVTGYTGSGIMVMGDYSNAGFTNVRITNNSVHDNVDCGIQSSAAYRWSIKNVYIGYNDVYSNYGDGVSKVTGSGIELGGVQYAMVEHNLAYMNGWKGGNGGVGIWAYESDHVIFQYCLSGNNHGLRGTDGDGFDFDLDTSNSIMQYCTAANNDGTGFQFDNWQNDNLFYGNAIRMCYAIDNGQRNGYGSLEVWGRVINSEILFNTVWVSPPRNGGSTEAFRIHNNTIAGLYAMGVHISNNTVYSSGGVPFLNMPSQETAGSGDVTFSSDTYYTGGATPTWIYSSSSYHTLASFTARSGQEKSGIVILSATAGTPRPALWPQLQPNPKAGTIYPSVYSGLNSTETPVYSLGLAQWLFDGGSTLSQLLTAAEKA